MQIWFIHRNWYIIFHQNRLHLGQSAVSSWNYESQCCVKILFLSPVPHVSCSYLARLHFHACCRVSMFLSGVLYLHWWKWHLEKQMSVVKDSHGSQEARRQIGAQHWISREKHLRHRLKKGLSVWQRVVLVRSEMNSILGAHLHWGTDCEDQLRPPSTSARHCL